ncbi:hypothetical protein MKO06_14030 [Gramella sp. GC03-9]|uniref:Uncharacterized protein n=1 Tax=Christiangramia oceanisediminis TaxID=2920386 RepID=A0A9X2KZ58_9FLAO|nr:hypothetical protein [Gramella oceanisediminis]MCP9201032.1 hypothetical protein [Gramella oceanisediminis]
MNTTSTQSEEERLEESQYLLNPDRTWENLTLYAIIILLVGIMTLILI